MFVVLTYAGSRQLSRRLREQRQTKEKKDSVPGVPGYTLILPAWSTRSAVPLDTAVRETYVLFTDMASENSSLLGAVVLLCWAAGKAFATAERPRNIDSRLVENIVVFFFLEMICLSW